MIEEADALETLAEIFAALAGFAALASAFQERRETLGHAYAGLRFVVLSSLVLLLVALIPVVAQHAEIPRMGMWRICCGAALLLNMVGVYQNVKSLRSVGATVRRSSAYVIWGLEGVSQIALLIGSFGLLPGQGGTLYLAYLWCSLAETSISFVNLLDETFASPG